MELLLMTSPRASRVYIAWVTASALAHIGPSTAIAQGTAGHPNDRPACLISALPKIPEVTTDKQKAEMLGLVWIAGSNKFDLSKPEDIRAAIEHTVRRRNALEPGIASDIADEKKLAAAAKAWNIKSTEQEEAQAVTRLGKMVRHLKELSAEEEVSVVAWCEDDVIASGDGPYKPRVLAALKRGADGMFTIISPK